MSNDIIGPEQKIPIKKFDLSEMVQHPAIVMIAKRGSGKSWICRAILKHLHTIPVGLIIAPTDKMSMFYGTFFPDSYIHYDYKSEIIEKLIYRQEQMIEKRKRYKAQGKYVDTRSIIIMDDCLAKKGSWMRDQPIAELLMNGRHYHITYILTMQYPLGITPELRGNFDYIFLMADNFQSNLKRMYDHYAGMFPSFDSFRQIFQELTKNFQAMVVINRGNNAEFFEQIKVYKAPNIDNVKIGCSQFRKYHEENYDNDWKKKKQQFNFTEFVMKKKKDKTALGITLNDNNDEQLHNFN
jgi:hypothetical protein